MKVTDNLNVVEDDYKEKRKAFMSVDYENFKGLNSLVGSSYRKHSAERTTMYERLMSKGETSILGVCSDTENIETFYDFFMFTYQAEKSAMTAIKEFWKSTAFLTEAELKGTVYTEIGRLLVHSIISNIHVDYTTMDGIEEFEIFEVVNNQIGDILEQIKPEYICSIRCNESRKKFSESSKHWKKVNDQVRNMLPKEKKMLVRPFGVENIYNHIIEHSQLLKGVMQLKEETSEVKNVDIFWDCFLKLKSYEEIASDYGITVYQVAARIENVAKALKNHLNKKLRRG